MTHGRRRCPVPAVPALGARSRNLVRHCEHLPHESLDASFAANFAFRDAGSRFSVLKSVKTEPGPDACFGLWARDDRTLFRKLLGMQVEYAGLDAARQARIVGYNSMSYFRSHIVEYFCHNGLEPMPPTEGDCVMWFADTDILCIRYRMVNKGPSPVAVRLRWFSEPDPGRACQGRPDANGFHFENTQHVSGSDYRGRAEVRAQDDGVRFHGDATRFESDWLEREIPPHGELVCRFAARFAFNDEEPPAWPRGLWRDASLPRAIAAAERDYARLPPLDARAAAHADLVLKAAGTLRSLRYRDRDAAGRRVMTMHVGKSGTAATWFWDTGCSLAGLALAGEREASRGAIDILTDGIRPDGTPPVTYEHGAYLYHYQIPLLTWGVGHFLELCPDPARMKRWYGPLGAYVRHWLDGYSTPRGLVVYPPGGTSLDDAVRWHTGSPLVPDAGKPWHAKDWGHPAPQSYESPEVNAFLYLELRTLAAMARALGRAAEAATWQARATALAAAINRWLLDPETNTYQDRHIDSGAYTGLISMATFIPVYAGIAPRAAARHMCHAYLLSPEHFLTDLPFPVIDRAHPTFRSGGFLHAPPAFPGALVQHSYWRGRTWIHGDYWLLGALWRSGFRREADEIAGKVLTAVSRSEGIHECYDSLTGFGNGHPEFLWSTAAVLALAYRHYRRPPVAKL